MAEILTYGVCRHLSLFILIILCTISFNGENSSVAFAQHSTINPTNTSSSTTTKAPVSSTTTSPVSTTTTVSPPPSTTLPQLPDATRWDVKIDGNVCILLEAGIRMKFNYIAQGTNKTINDAMVDVPKNKTEVTVEGECGKTKQRMSLIFFDDWNLTVTFGRNSSDDDYHMTEVYLKYVFSPNEMPFVNAAPYSNSSERLLGSDFYRTDVGHSYICTSQQTMLEGHGVGLVSVNFYDTQVEAFRMNSTNMDFSEQGGRCREDEMNLLVPIVVGACLAGLIVIVLVAYFIGRQRSKRGYENV